MRELAALLVVITFVLHHAVAQTIYAGSSHGNVYKLDENLQPTVIARPCADASLLAVRPKDGQAMSKSSPTGVISGALICSFNVNGLVINTTTFSRNTFDLVLGPFYDPKLDRFFLFVWADTIGPLSLTTIDPISMSLGPLSPVQMQPQQEPVESALRFVFDPISRTVCGVSFSRPRKYRRTCISVDHLVYTSQQPSDDAEAFFAVPAVGLMGVDFSDLVKSCVSTEGGSIAVSLIDVNGPGSKLLTSLSNLSPSLCPFNSAVMANTTTSMIFSLLKTPGASGFWVTNIAKRSNKFVSTPNEDFARNIQSFLLV